MSLSEQFFETDDHHPIDIVESIASSQEWEFDRIADDQIAMAVEGQWRTYSITLAWSDMDQTLRLICTFEMEPPSETLPALYDLLNRTNDLCWSGAFTYWADQRLMVYRYGLVLSGAQQGPAPQQISTIISSAVDAAERFYPAFQLVGWGGKSPEDAVQMAMTQAYGRA